MTIQELINELQGYKNKQAKVLITIGNEDSDFLSTGDFECMNKDETYEYIEIFIDQKKCKIQL